MKLIDILVRELPGIGGWPKGIDAVNQGWDGLLESVVGGISFSMATNIRLPLSDRFRGAGKSVTSSRAEVVTREQYEFALTAASPNCQCWQVGTIGDAVAEAVSGLERKAENKSPYLREIKPGVWIDAYDVLNAWGVTNPALQHLLKKALQPGERGHKSREQDLQDIIDSAIRAKELEISK